MLERDFEKELETLERVPVVGPMWAFMARMQLSLVDAVNLMDLRGAMYPDTPQATPQSEVRHLPEPRTEAAVQDDPTDYPEAA